MHYEQISVGYRFEKLKLPPHEAMSQKIFMFNHFEFHSEFTDKANLLANLHAYCKVNSIKLTIALKDNPII
jgi:hypothetical protein